MCAPAPATRERRPRCPRGRTATPAGSGGRRTGPAASAGSRGPAASCRVGNSVKSTAVSESSSPASLRRAQARRRCGGWRGGPEARREAPLLLLQEGVHMRGVGVPLLLDSEEAGPGEDGAPGGGGGGGRRLSARVRERGAARVPVGGRRGACVSGGERTACARRAPCTSRALRARRPRLCCWRHGVGRMRREACASATRRAKNPSAPAPPAALDRRPGRGWPARAHLTAAMAASLEAMADAASLCCRCNCRRSSARGTPREDVSAN